MERWKPHFNFAEFALEMGSFDGTMTDLLRGYFDKIEVVEGSEKLAEVVRQKFNQTVNVHVSWFEEFQPTQKYGQIFLVHGLEHVDDPVEVLRKSASWLSETGKLFVAVPNANALSRQIAVKMGLVETLQSVTEGEEKHGHQRTYNLDTLHHDFQLAGLEIIDSGGVVFKPLSNWQFDSAIKAEIVSSEYVSACDELAKVWPEFSSSIYVVATASK